jgi:hypothetical protein
MSFRSALSLSVPLAMLAACAVSPPQRPVGDPPAVGNEPAAQTRPPIEPAAQTPVAPQSVVGIVESASVVSLPSVPSAAGGASRPSSSPTMAYRVQMPDGSTQSIVQPGERFEVGERVRVTPDRRLTRP